MFSEARRPREFALVPRTFMTVPSISCQSRSGLARAARRTVREVSSAAQPVLFRWYTGCTRSKDFVYAAGAQFFQTYIRRFSIRSD